MNESPEAIRARVCGQKVRHEGPGPARAHAIRLGEESPGSSFGHYRCPFCHFWHAGHVPSLAGLEALSRVMRGLPPGDPKPHDPPARRRRRRKEKRPVTDLVPVHVHESEEPVAHLAATTAPPAEPEREEDLVRWLRGALLVVEERRRELADAGEWEALAFGLVALKTITDDLRIVLRTIEDDVVRLLPSKRVEVDGLGVLEKKRSSTRKAWQSEELLDRVLRIGIDPEGTGELPAPGELVSRLRAALVAAVPFTSSLGWRVSALRELGLDPDEWCESTPGRMGLQITDNRKDDE